MNSGNVLVKTYAVCSNVKAELFAGAMCSTDPINSACQAKAFHQLVRFYAVRRSYRRSFCRIKAALFAAGTPIGEYDIQIAAIALANGLTLVTHNVGEYGRCDGLKKED